MKGNKDGRFVTLTHDVMVYSRKETLAYWTVGRRREAVPTPMLCGGMSVICGCVPTVCGCSPAICGCFPKDCGCKPVSGDGASEAGDGAGSASSPVGGEGSAAGNGMPAVGGMPPVGGVPPLGGMPPVGGGIPAVGSGSEYRPEPQEVLDITPPEVNGPPATDPKQADLTKMPFSAGGKLFYVMDNVQYVASGNIFMNGRLLLTAAHCVQNKFTGNVGDHYLFSRAYGGEISAEDLTFGKICVRKEWVETKDSRYDYAIVVLDGESDAPAPLKYTLSQDIEGKTATSVGYPVKYFVGEQMVFVDCPVSSIPGREGLWGMVGSQMSPGSSGGAWVLEDGETAVGLNAFASYSPSGEMLLSGSPRFDSNFESLYRYALTLI